VDFFFIDEVVFPCGVERRWYRIRWKRVNVFLIFSRNIHPEPIAAANYAPDKTEEKAREWLRQVKPLRLTVR
jgi:hypothetical protein